MAVVIRLQGLPLVAGSADIRHFFSGLNISNGGVHIIGGELGEAFIIFATDDDARLAMRRSGGFIKQSRIQLQLSSKSEMQSTIEMRWKRDEHGGREPMPAPRHYGSNIQGPTGDGNFSNAVPPMKRGMNKPGYIPSDRPDHNAGFNSGIRHDTDMPKPYYNQGRREVQPFDSDDLYLFLHGMPYSATDEEVRAFFHGLHVDGVIFLQHQSGPNVGRNNGDGLVKFATRKDALDGLRRNKEYMGTRFIELSQATKEQWKESGGFVAEDVGPHMRSGERYKNRPRSRSPRNERPRSRSPHSQELYVHIRNLSYSVEKRDIKLFFQSLEVSDNQIKFLYDNHNNRTRDGFVLFKNERDYHIALSLHKEILNNRTVYIYPIAVNAMLELIESNGNKELTLRDQPGEEDMADNGFQDAPMGPRLYLYIRNFPFDVTKIEVQKFFVGFSLNDDDICLLYDDKGVGLGEALVKFPTEELAAHAENLNRRRFLGTEVLLQRISQEQVREFGINAFPGEHRDRMPDQPPFYGMDRVPRPGNARGPPMQPFRGPGDFRHGPEEFTGPPKNFRGPPPPRMGFGSNRFDPRNNGREGYPERRFRPDYGVAGGNSGGPAVIQLKNMPFTTTVNEILDFFYGYRVIPDSVSIRYNEGGLPTGIATVAIENYNEAMAAVAELNDRPVGPRKVKLSLI
ncbi:RNA-binding protein 12B [Microcaecilia unicolor]|uniref:RNA-binding protein 12B-like n=1 Tax=Microcaecilia unicolor TaxID=1415580 RepID=A0A6P7Z4V6_9AMPH|nr:RNA-binding protein 12B-like [Microcaecilia unicolor]XP_030072407.1 RNA-binding protein 12B-like [Microcaecilia unicolor]XP_030072413.1 RNA-binding protein 12B-like [Microcaecilia unicolor]XP_030072421.1 RNA-binding protein 12B-like [Microcaecilia unicolor]XP_030072429.1 RNA-binding protein 12B-like [Microcaecilia unicolor]XP_030072435.1 RNA-binding protein 12B-like [Microcaecilia unicolor]XP_030072440.1 RNA-binding protein 12B-like [Microcaecilia unicolor]XP_030072448.1 RNA-binding prote